jgi:hypothetical protein
MSDDRAFEHAVDDWLAQGSDRAPRPSVDAVLLAIRTTPQERDLRISWRTRPMTTPLRLGVSIAMVAIVGVVALNMFGPVAGIGVGPAATPSPTASAAPSPTPADSADPLDPSAWTPYTSSRYGFTLAYPPDWTAIPATRAWTFEADASDPVLTPAADSFMAPTGDVRASAWAIPLAGATIESEDDFMAWVASYCERTGSRPCTGIPERAVPFCLERRDCHYALVVPFADDVQAFFSGGIYDAEAMTVVSVWRADDDPPVASYGGSLALLEAFLSTMDVWPAPGEEPAAS